MSKIFLKYEYKGKEYIFFAEAKTKCLHTNKWIKSIIYQSTEDSELYCRTEKDFKSKFKKID